MRQYTSDFEPVAPHSFDDLWEKKLTSVQQVKGETCQHFKWKYEVLECAGAPGFK
jgi:cephalosporin-C deacetylase-like acetyl esterase